MKNLFTECALGGSYYTTIKLNDGSKIDLWFKPQDENKFRFHFYNNETLTNFILNNTKKHLVKKDEFNFVIYRVRELVKDFSPFTGKADLQLSSLVKEYSELIDRMNSIEREVSKLLDDTKFKRTKFPKCVENYINTRNEFYKVGNDYYNNNF